MPGFLHSLSLNFGVLLLHGLLQGAALPGTGFLFPVGKVPIVQIMASPLPRERGGLCEPGAVRKTLLHLPVHGQAQWEKLGFLRGQLWVLGINIPMVASGAVGFGKLLL